MRASVQSALNNRVSRIDVDLPIGAEFGVEQGGEQERLHGCESRGTCAGA